MQVLSGIFDKQLTVLSGRPFFSIINNYQSREFHYHNCIEFTYVLSGSGKQIIILPNGRVETQTLSKGNYTIVDTNAKHAYVNGSDDFTLINLLFHSSFLFNNRKNRAFQNGFCISMNGNNDATGVDIKFELKESQKVEDNNYIRLWMDLKGDSQERSFFDVKIGIIVNGEVSAPYFQRASKNSTFYFLREGERKWIPINNVQNDCFRIDNLSDEIGFPGWFAFPVDKMYQEKTGRFLTRDDLITGISFYYSSNGKNMSDRYFFVDDIKFVENYDGGTKNILKDDRMINIDKDLLTSTVVAEDENQLCKRQPEQISVSELEPEDFYKLIKQTYPEFDYSKILATDMNRAFYDKDGSILSLFKMCHSCSCEHQPEWRQIAKNGISLIILSALQSMISEDKPVKENIVDIVKQYVDAHYEENITLSEICEKNFYNASYISRRFKELVNCTFEQYLRQVRIRHAGEMLLCTDLSVSEVGRKCGYASAGAFRKAFMVETGKNPLEFKKTYKNS